MFWINTKRVFRSGFINFWRNGFVSLSAVLAMTLAVFVVACVIFLTATFNYTLKEINNKVDVNVYFITLADESDILTIKKSLERLPEVESVNYISRETALDNFKKKHEGEELILQALSELSDNPLGASLNIKAKDPSQYAGIASFLKSNDVLSKDKTPIIDKINYYENKLAIDQLNKITSLANKFGFWLALVFILVAIIVTLNTVRLVIYISKDEISVMRLVGANSKYVKGPFVVSGLLYSIISSLIVIIGLFPLTYWIGSITQNFFSGLNFFSYYLSNFFSIFGILFGSSLVVGLVASLIAVRKYLKH